jgi:hypothetical protein
MHRTTLCPECLAQIPSDPHLANPVKALLNLGAPRPARLQAQLSLGGFAQEDPLMAHSGLVGDMGFLSDLGHAPKAEQDDFLDLFLKDSIAEEL